MGDVASAGEGVVNCASMCEAWESVSSEGVSSPSRSSPSEELSSSSSCAPSYSVSARTPIFPR